MNNNFNLKKTIPYILAIIGFLIITFLYFSPLLSGKTVSMHDSNMTSSAAKELVDYHAKTGEWAWWTNSMFGGMPSFMIAGGYPYSLSSKIGAFFTSFLPNPANSVFLLMVGFFVFMLALKRNIWIAFAGAFAYSFGTYNMIFLEAGHISKIIALAYGPVVLAGFIYIFRGKYLLGTFLSALFIALEIYANHLQITYYFIFIYLAYIIYEFYKILKEKEFSKIPKIVACLAISGALAIGMNGMRLWNNYTYSKETTRGKSELKTTTVGKEGLDKDYAFSYSYGLLESFTLMIPSIEGGSSSGSLDKSSETYKAMISSGVDAGNTDQFVSQLPLYHGNQSGTSGPAYSGIIIVFLFILGLFINKSKFKWAITALALFFLVTSWGSSMASINDLLFEYLPGYNKFRAVTMTLTIVHFLLIWGATNTLSTLFESEVNWDFLKNKFYITFGICSVLMFMAYFANDYSSANDSGLKESLSKSLGAESSNRIVNALLADRESLAFSDIIRGLILMLLTSALFFFHKKNKFSEKIIGFVLVALLVFDLFSVDKRYFNNDDFMNKTQARTSFEPSPQDLEILKDSDPNFKVINLTTSFWADARDSYFHKSIGGYHGAKLKKIQELYEYQMTKDGRLNMPILNMLNVKYFITNDQTNKPVVQKNPEVLGNAWFVDTLAVVDNADIELKEVGSFQPKTKAITQKNQSLNGKIYKTNIANSIKLESYTPNVLIYKSNASSEQFAVFSEIFYKGNEDWKSYIDGKSVNHGKVNYTLRGMEIPAGAHEIKFEFRPQSVLVGTKIDLISSISTFCLFLATVFVSYKTKKD